MVRLLRLCPARERDQSYDTWRRLINPPLWSVVATARSCIDILFRFQSSSSHICSKRSSSLSSSGNSPSVSVAAFTTSSINSKTSLTKPQNIFWSSPKLNLRLKDSSLAGTVGSAFTSISWKFEQVLQIVYVCSDAGGGGGRSSLGRRNPLPLSRFAVIVWQFPGALLVLCTRMVSGNHCRYRGTCLA